jgi:hypothetical protein
MVKIIHINPATHTIAEREVDGSLKSYQSLVGGKIEPIVNLGDGENLWSNGDMFDLPRPFAYFMLDGA